MSNKEITETATYGKGFDLVSFDYRKGRAATMRVQSSDPKWKAWDGRNPTAPCARSLVLELLAQGWVEC